MHDNSTKKKLSDMPSTDILIRYVDIGNATNYIIYVFNRNVDKNQQEGSCMDEQYFTVSEIAAKLKVKDSTIWLWIRTGKLGCIRIGRNYRISQKNLDDYVNRNQKVLS